MKYIVISKEEWDALFAGKTQTLLRMPYERPDEYKAGDKLLVRGVYQKETASVTVKRVACRGLEYTPGKVIRLSDPSCGSSVLLIEGAEQLIADGVRQSDLLLIAGDIDHRACDISYIQLSLLGYAAIVQHADALAMKRISQDRFTPGYFLHSMPMRCVLRHEQQPSSPSPFSSAVVGSPGDAARGSRPQYQQLDLFGSVA